MVASTSFFYEFTFVNLAQIVVAYYIVLLSYPFALFYLDLPN